MERGWSAGGGAAVAVESDRAWVWTLLQVEQNQVNDRPLGFLHQNKVREAQ